VVFPGNSIAVDGGSNPFIFCETLQLSVSVTMIDRIENFLLMAVETLVNMTWEMTFCLGGAFLDNGGDVDGKLLQNKRTTEVERNLKAVNE
jgi:hypothetical protein